MRILIAPQSYKGSLSASGVAEAIARGVPPSHKTDLLPVADGGEGTVDALLAALGGERRETNVEDPLGRPISAAWGLLPDGRAVVEMAAASGLPLLEDNERDPRRATTFGTGQLIAAALDAGATVVIIGLGGSATNDGGAWALAALGARLLDSGGKELPRSVIHLQRLARVDFAGLHPRLREAKLRVMCDVTNPLLGPAGATAVYGPQKGVNEPMRPRLEAALERWADVLEKDAASWRNAERPEAGTGTLCRDGGRGQGEGALRDQPGAGAAGGLGFGLLAVGAVLEPGAELVLELAGFAERVAQAGLVITGEGRLDRQSLYGKSTIAVARAAKRAGVPVLAIVGGLGDGYEAAYAEGIRAIVPTAPGPISIEEAQSRAAELITAATERAFLMMRLGLYASRPRRQ